MAPNTPQEWFDLLNKRFTAKITPSWSDKSSRPLMVRQRNQQLDLLWSYRIGDPPLPSIADEYEDVFRDIMRKARCNYAPMCVQAMLDRMELQAVSTSQDRTANGDDIAAEIMEESGFGAQFKDLLDYQFSMREAFAMVVPRGAGKNPTVHAIDPRRCVGIVDKTNPIRLLAALVKEWDEVEEAELAHLFLPGQKWTFRLKDGVWTHDENPEASEVPAELGGIPVVRFANPHNIGEYEAHLDVLDRIIDTTLQRIVLTKYQAFKQRAVSGDEDEDTEVTDETDDERNDFDGKKHDLGEVFRADPGAVWKVPAGWQFWESGQADMQGMLNAKRDDAKEFAAVTFTPLYLITPDDANGSAAGAGLLREGLTSKVRDRRTRSVPPLKLLWRIIFAMRGDAARGETLRFHWGPIEFRSLAEKGSATAQAQGSLSNRKMLSEVWEMTPEDIEENQNELAADALLGIGGAPRPPTPPTAPAGAPPPEPPRVTDDLPVPA